MYYKILPNIYSTCAILKEPLLPPSVHFSVGRVNEETLQEPLELVTSCDRDNPPGHAVGSSVPAWSQKLVDAVRACGVDNFQTYQAKLLNEQTGDTWTNYLVVNVIGLISAVDLERSTAIKIADRPYGAVGLYGINELVFRPELVRGLRLFRLAEDPSFLMMEESVVDQLADVAPPDGWGITARPVDEG